MPANIITGDDNGLFHFGIAGLDNFIDALGGNDTLIGADGNDILDGGLGNDNLTGGTGDDILKGGLGDDLYVISELNDIVIEFDNGGLDEVSTAIDYILPDFIENLSVAAFAGGNRTLTGNGRNNSITGGIGNDKLDGAGGADIMAGGVGNDDYFVDNAGDQVLNETADANGGLDDVFTSVNFTLSDNVERLRVIDPSTTNNLVLKGNVLDNDINGNNGDNLIDGFTGADDMSGSQGNDTYIVDTAGDSVREFANQGNDTVQTFVSFSVGTQSIETVEALFFGATLTGGANNETLLGAIAAVDVLIGNAGNDTLNGRGGNDTMNGGLGNDILVVDSAKDVVIELAGQGTDTVQASASFSAGTAAIETLIALGANAINLTAGSVGATLVGNAAANTLTGGTGSDILNGGAGIDRLVGGRGNDVYTVDTSKDVVVEASNGGTDRINADFSFSLAKLTQVENLSASSSGLKAINFTGNALGNTLSGNAGKNTLTGAAGNDKLSGGAGDDKLFGGAGTDLLTGGAGKDQFVFDNNARDKKFDTIVDYNVKDDSIVLNNSGFFGKIGSNGKLKASAFELGKVADDANDRVIYDRSSGKLFFDADGNGSGAQVLVAQLKTKPALTINEFVII